MPLQPEVEQLLDMVNTMNPPPIESQTPTEVREMFTAMGAAGAASGPSVPSSDQAIGDIGVRVYDPPGSSPDGPTLVWYHGGGWVIGDLTTADPTCRHLASRTGMRVVSVDYRLAPEAPYPAAADDALAAFEAVAGGKLGGPPAAIAVGGDSAGGNLAAVVSLMARDKGGRVPDFQLLVYPVIDAAMDTDSYRDNADGYFLTAPAMAWFYGHYAGAHGADPYVSPIRAASLAGLPPALVITAEYDPLRDEGEAYAAALRAAGVAVESRRYDGQIHGFFGMAEMCGPSAFEAIDQAAAALVKVR